MSQILLNSISTVQPPYNIFVCNVYGNFCTLVATINNPVPSPITLTLPPQYDTVPLVGIKIVNSGCCESFEIVNCSTSTTCLVQDGFIMYLDASNKSSYPTTGSTWTNLVGSENVTLLNNPSFETTNYGLINFDHTSSQYGTYPNLGQLTAFTVSVWYKMKSLPTAGAYFPALVTDSITHLNINYVVGSTNFGNNQLMSGGFHNGAWHVTSGFDIIVDEWVFVSLTYDGNELKLYKNNSLFSSTVVGATAQTDGSVGYINRRWDNPDYYDVDIPVIQIYNRDLSLSEIIQNYDCLSNRYNA